MGAWGCREHNKGCYWVVVDWAEEVNQYQYCDEGRGDVFRGCLATLCWAAVLKRDWRGPEGGVSPIPFWDALKLA